MAESAGDRLVARLYELTPSEFMTLASELLADTGYTDLRELASGHSGGVLSARRDGETVHVLVLHKLRLREEEVHDFIGGDRESPIAAPALLVVTSALVPPTLVKEVAATSDSRPIGILGRAEILEFMRERDEASPVLKRAESRSKRRWLQLVLASVALVSSLVSLVVPLLYQAPPTPLNQRIRNVDAALAGMRDLEDYLRDVRQDMVQTQEATRRLDEEYASAQRLSQLSDAELESVRAALLQQSWRDSLAGYLGVFVMGVASSLIATVLYGMFRQRSSLR